MAKPKTTLRRQAWLAAGGAFAVWLLAILLAVAAAWVLWRQRGAGIGLTALLIVSSLTVLGAASVLFDKSLIPIRGYRAERRVCRELTKLPDEYWILNDVQINAGGKSAQIDHVLVSPHGIWCIETKSWLGRIFGKRWDRTWTQVKQSERGRTHKRQMPNPVQQNEWHRQQLDDYLKARLGFWCPIKCLVVLTGGPLMKGVQNVVYMRDVRREVQRADTRGRLNEQQVQRILGALLEDKP